MRRSIDGAPVNRFCEGRSKRLSSPARHCVHSTDERESILKRSRTMSAKASIPHGALAQNLLATVDASADPSRPPIHPDTLALYDLWLASGANTAPPPTPASDDDEEEDYSDDDDADDFGPLQSSFYGVAWDRKKGRWRAAVRLAKRLGYEGQVYNIGMFDHAWVGVRSLTRSFEGVPEATVSP